MDKRLGSEILVLDVEGRQQEVRVSRAVLLKHSVAEIVLLLKDHFREGEAIEESPKIESPVLIDIEKFTSYSDFPEKQRKPAKKGRNKWFRRMK